MKLQPWDVFSNVFLVLVTSYMFINSASGEFELNTFLMAVLLMVATILHCAATLKVRQSSPVSPKSKNQF